MISAKFLGLLLPSLIFSAALMAQEGEAVKTEKTEAPKTEEAKTEAAKTEAAKTEAPKTEEAKTEAPKTAEVKTEEAKTEPAKTEEAKTVEIRPGKKIENLEAGLVGEYFKFGDGEAVDYLPAESDKKPEFRVLDDQVAFETGEGAFGAANFETNLYVRWKGYVRLPAAGKYMFFLASDDGSRLALDGKQIIDNSGMHGTVEKSGEVELGAGDYPVVIEFYQGGGPGNISFSWQIPGGQKELIPAKALFHEPDATVKKGAQDKAAALRKEKQVKRRAVEEKRLAAAQAKAKVAEKPELNDAKKAKEEAEKAYQEKLQATEKEDKDYNTALKALADEEAALQKVEQDLQNLNKPADAPAPAPVPDAAPAPDALNP